MLYASTLSSWGQNAQPIMKFLSSKPRISTEYCFNQKMSLIKADFDAFQGLNALSCLYAAMCVLYAAFQPMLRAFGRV
jgi:hypothetical protein